MRRIGAAFLLFLVAPVPALVAQTTDAAIVGRVLAETEPLADVEVEVLNAATGFRATVISNASGRFAFLQLPLGGPYRLTARRVGYEPETRDGYTLGLGDRIDLELELRAVAVELAAIEVRADTLAERRQRIGGNSRIDGDALATLPTANRNFTDLTSLTPSAGSQQSLFGQRWTSTDVRLDGLQARNLTRAGEYGAGPYTLSIEAIREFEVNANVYDVSQGRQGGGSISAATRSGTNTLAGTVFGYYRNDGLSAGTDFLGRGRDVRDFTAVQWGASVGGPIVRDRAHFFVAFDRQDGSEPLFTGLVRTPQEEIVAGVAADSLTRLISILQTLYGLDGSTPQLGRLDRSPTANTLFARLDWELGARHRLTLRHNYGDFDNPLSGGVDQPITLEEARSNFRSREHQALAALRSTLGAATQNELKLGFSSARRTLDPVTRLPRGFVRIRSNLPDGNVGDIRVQFGGNRLAPDDSRETQVQLIDHVYVQRGNILFTAGTDNSLARLTTFIAEGQSGLFEFETLGDLEALRPFRFSRAVPLASEPMTHQHVLELGLYAQAEWRPSPALAITGGARWDGASFLTTPAYNPLADQALGVRTDRRPESWVNLQPRAQIVWMPGRDGRNIVRLGGGLFTAQLPYYAQHNQLLNDGLQVIDIDIRTGLPLPDYLAFRSDPATIPGIPAGSAAPPAFVNVVGDGFTLPRTWKASVSYQRHITDWLTLTGSLLASKTNHNYYYVDRNLVASPAFRLDNESTRPVFVPAATIDSRGRTNVRNALQDPHLSRVLELVSIGEANQRSVVAEAALRLPAGGSAWLSYTWNRARDNSTYGCCLARTATTFTAIPGDPRDLSGSWGSSDLDFRHKVVVVAASPELWGFRLGARYVGQNGRPFSAVVNGDINGDESNANDLAFVFNPADPATPPDVAAAMERVLDNPDNVAAEYLHGNLGRIATRNGAFAPWNSRIDLRLSKRIGTFRGQAAELTVDVFNFANLLDGDWGGQYLLPQGISNQNPVVQRVPLLNVIGFDQTTRRYIYSVNESFGVLQKQGDPYQIQLGVRYAF
ncbi:MAG TPA: carboxypeptidase-like regulatory domain-containing protein [Gemmatimonadales bacterium]|nr:carboxypeptidase-like regulatory domain-containing protein [Gemmatimonadales bacterium]